MIGDDFPPNEPIEARVGVYACPTCGAESRFRGTCRACKKAAKGTASTRRPIPKPSNRDKRRARVKARSDKRIAEQAALNALKAILGPFVKKCLRCNQPNPEGQGFKSKARPRGLEFHHLFRRRGWFFFLGVPLCEDCHREVEEEGEAARRDRWVIPEPIRK